MTLYGISDGKMDVYLPCKNPLVNGNGKIGQLLLSLGSFAALVGLLSVSQTCQHNSNGILKRMKAFYEKLNSVFLLAVASSYMLPIFSHCSLVLL